MIFVELYNIINKKRFIKKFDTEFERDKFIRKLRYSKNLTLIKIGEVY